MTVILTRSDVRAMLDYDSCISAVENAFRAEAGGNTIPASVLATHVDGGGFHVKTAGLKGERLYYAMKINANFPGNPTLRGLPTVQGVISLHDAVDGRLLALMDSMEVTTIRTAAATAVAAKYLARPDSRTATIIGCGVQGRSHLLALSRVVKLEKVFASDSNNSVAETFAGEMSDELHIDITAVTDYRSHLGESDIIATCTSAREPILTKRDVSAGTFVAAVGADSESKSEIAPDLMSSSTVVVDVLEQCATFGDLRHAIDAGVMSRENVHADLAQIVSGKRPGRSREDEITLFDSTGTALEDVAAASLLYERALSMNRGLNMELGA
jgi:alanine dehydrogenase